MSAAEKVVHMPKLEPGQSLIKAKIATRTKIGKTYIHVLSAPAVDEYSYPKAYEVSSTKPLGEVDEVVTVKVEITGRRTQKTHNDKDTGEVKKFPGAFVGLRAIEE